MHYRRNKEELTNRYFPQINEINYTCNLTESLSLCQRRILSKAYDFQKESLDFEKLVSKLDGLFYKSVYSNCNFRKANEKMITSIENKVSELIDMMVIESNFGSEDLPEEFSMEKWRNEFKERWRTDGPGDLRCMRFYKFLCGEGDIFKMMKGDALKLFECCCWGLGTNNNLLTFLCWNEKSIFEELRKSNFNLRGDFESQLNHPNTKSFEICRTAKSVLFRDKKEIVRQIYRVFKEVSLQFDDDKYYYRDQLSVEMNELKAKFRDLNRSRYPSNMYRKFLDHSTTYGKKMNDPVLLDCESTAYKFRQLVLELQYLYRKISSFKNDMVAIYTETFMEICEETKNRLAKENYFKSLGEIIQNLFDYKGRSDIWKSQGTVSMLNTRQYLPIFKSSTSKDFHPTSTGVPLYLESVPLQESQKMDFSKTLPDGFNKGNPKIEKLDLKDKIREERRKDLEAIKENSNKKVEYSDQKPKPFFENSPPKQLKPETITKEEKNIHQAPVKIEIKQIIETKPIPQTEKIIQHQPEKIIQHQPEKIIQHQPENIIEPIPVHKPEIKTDEKHLENSKSKEKVHPVPIEFKKIDSPKLPPQIISQNIIVVPIQASKPEIHQEQNHHRNDIQTHKDQHPIGNIIAEPKVEQKPTFIIPEKNKTQEYNPSFDHNPKLNSQLNPTYSNPNSNMHDQPFNSNLQYANQNYNKFETKINPINESPIINNMPLPQMPINTEYNKNQTSHQNYNNDFYEKDKFDDFGNEEDEFDAPIVDEKHINEIIKDKNDFGHYEDDEDFDYKDEEFGKENILNQIKQEVEIDDDFENDKFDDFNVDDDDLQAEVKRNHKFDDKPKDDYDDFELDDDQISDHKNEFNIANKQDSFDKEDDFEMDDPKIDSPIHQNKLFDKAKNDLDFEDLEDNNFDDFNVDEDFEDDKYKEDLDIDHNKRDSQDYNDDFEDTPGRNVEEFKPILAKSPQTNAGGLTRAEKPGNLLEEEPEDFDDFEYDEMNQGKLEDEDLDQKEFPEEEDYNDEMLDEEAMKKYMEENQLEGEIGGEEAITQKLFGKPSDYDCINEYAKSSKFLKLRKVIVIDSYELISIVFGEFIAQQKGFIFDFPETDALLQLGIKISQAEEHEDQAALESFSQELDQLAQQIMAMIIESTDSEELNPGMRYFVPLATGMIEINPYLQRFIVHGNVGSEVEPLMGILTEVFNCENYLADEIKEEGELAELNPYHAFYLRCFVNLYEKGPMDEQPIIKFDRNVFTRAEGVAKVCQDIAEKDTLQDIIQKLENKQVDGVKVMAHQVEDIEEVSKVIQNGLDEKDCIGCFVVGVSEETPGIPFYFFVEESSVSILYLSDCDESLAETIINVVASVTEGNGAALNIIEDFTRHGIILEAVQVTLNVWASLTKKSKKKLDSLKNVIYSLLPYVEESR